MRALQELEVRSPLRECGHHESTGEKTIERSRSFYVDKPGICMSGHAHSRGDPDQQRRDLDRVEQAENAMSALGFRDFRVRLYGGGARLQVTGEQMQLADGETKTNL